jgi:hypothetical protein
VVTVSKQSPNGLPAPAAVSGQRSTLTPPRIERWLDVPDHPGYRVKLWINYPRILRDAFKPIDPDELEGMDEETLEQFGTEKKNQVMDALAAIVLEHNGWPDEDGNVLPQPTDPTIWDRADQHLANVVIVLARQAPSQLPNSLSPTKRR